MSNNEYENQPKKKLDVYKSGDLVILDETRYFGYNVENIKNSGGIFSDDYMIFYCCGEQIKQWVGRKDCATLLNHLKTKHNMICVKNIEEDPKNKRIKIEYQIKCIL